MIVAGPGGFDKSQYRKFNIKPEELTPGDDFGMMRQVLTRRFGRLLSEESAEKAPPRPDLVLIDGGAGQLSAAQGVFETLGLTDIPLVAISKGPDRNAGREEFHLSGRPSFMLEPRDPVLYYLQRLRDEAHRFAIGTHRAKRAKAFTGSVLDEVSGIGPARKRALLHHFGSARGVERASLADLEKVEGVSKAMAQRIFDHFRGGA
jgi:excinuclease ABC subunit C